MTRERPMADGDRYRDLFADLTPEEVRAITGLVRAMREKRLTDVPINALVAIVEADAALDDARKAFDEMNATEPADEAFALCAEAAWHIAHAISQMGES